MSKLVSIMSCYVIFIVFLSVPTIYIGVLYIYTHSLSLSLCIYNAHKSQEPVLQITLNITHEQSSHHTPVLHMMNTENKLYCWRGVLTMMLHSNDQDSDSIESQSCNSHQANSLAH